MDKSDDQLLKDFIEEFFDFDGLLEVGFFKEEMRGDYKAQAERICTYFGYKTVYEFGATEIRGHISPITPKKGDPFVTVIPSIYDDQEL